MPSGPGGFPVLSNAVEGPRLIRQLTQEGPLLRSQHGPGAGGDRGGRGPRIGALGTQRFEAALDDLPPIHYLPTDPCLPTVIRTANSVRLRMPSLR